MTRKRAREDEVRNGSVESLTPAGQEGSSAGLISLLTLSMTMSMLVLFAISSLAPFILDDLNITRSQVGLLITGAFGVAALLSLYAGVAVDAVGSRSALLWLFGLLAVAFTMAAAAPSYGVLLAAVVVAGFSQALANPASNKVVAELVPQRKRGMMVGVKQSGVQLGALLAGLALPPVAAVYGWRWAILCLVPLCLLCLLAVLRVLPADTRPRRTQDFRLPPGPNKPLRWLIAYSLFIGCGMAATNTYLPLYAHEALDLEEAVAGLSVAVLGVSGVLARIGWTSLADRLSGVSWPMAAMACSATVSVLFLAQAELTEVALLWIAVIGVGASAVAANAISMLAVVRDRSLGATGNASALVSLGFFAGFALSPPVFGVLIETTGGYLPGWLLVAAQFGTATLCALGLRRARFAAGS